MKVLITGITGMVGSHLADYILDHHPAVEMHGLVRWRSPLDNIRRIESRVVLHQGSYATSTRSFWSCARFSRI